MGRVSTCQKNCKTIDLRGAQVNKRMHIFNACGQSCIMMILEGSKMSKTEYDLTAIMYSAYDTPYKLCNIKGN